jgi:hypothetical protein
VGSSRSWCGMVHLCGRDIAGQEGRTVQESGGGKIWLEQSSDSPLPCTSERIALQMTSL